mgnify:CR=1 FL=1
MFLAETEQAAIQRAIPRFLGHSYLALPMLEDPYLLGLSLIFKPELGRNFGAQIRPTLLLRSVKFSLLLDEMNRIELRYLTSQSSGGRAEITRVIGSRDVETNRWNQLIITDASSDAQEGAPIDGVNRIVLVTPDKISLDSNHYNSSQLFVAGIPDVGQIRAGVTERESASSEDTVGGFVGCIKELQVNSRLYNFRSDLNGDTLDGFDIGKLKLPSASNAHHLVLSS